MEGDRRYRQHGYNDSDRQSGANGGPRQDDRPRQQSPRPPIDVTGPRLPRLVQAVAAARCYNCAVTLPQDVDFRGSCPKCNAALHCCKQCAFFEPSTRFQCTKPIVVRIAPKDQANQCDLFRPRVTVARDAPAHSAANGGIATGPAANIQVPKSAGDARAAFDSLFKKP